MIQLREDYDWIVLGESMGSLLSAALLARQGMNVLILPLQERAKGFLSQNGQWFEPESNQIVGLGEFSRDDSILVRILHSIIPVDKEWRAAIVKRSALTLEGPTFRESVTPEDLLSDLGFASNTSANFFKKFAHSEAEQVNRYWYKLPERLTFVLKKKKGANLAKGKLEKPPREKDFWKELKRRTFNEGKLESVLKDLLRWKGEVAKGELNSFSVEQSMRLAALSSFLEGIWSANSYQKNWNGDLFTAMAQLSLSPWSAGFKMGRSGFISLLRQTAEKLGAHRTDLECKRIFIENGRFKGVQLANKGSMITSTGAAVGGHLLSILPLTPKSQQPYLQKVDRKQKRQATGWRFTLAISAKLFVVPQALENGRLIWSEPGAPSLEIEICSPADYMLKNCEVDEKLIFLRTNLPFLPETLSVAYQKEVSGKMWFQLTQILPFVERGVIRMFPDINLDSLEKINAQFQFAYPFSSLAQIPSNLLVFGDGPSGINSGIKGLFLAGPQAYPEWGTFGEVRSAVETAAWLAHALGIPGPFGELKL